MAIEIALKQERIMSKIEIAYDTPEAEEFAAWLRAQGHEANVGATTGNLLDGVSTANSYEAQQTINALWESYCAS